MMNNRGWTRTADQGQPPQETLPQPYLPAPYPQQQMPQQSGGFFTYGGGYYPVQVPQEIVVAEEKPKEERKKKQPFQKMVKDFVDKETKSPQWLKVFAFAGLGLISSVFMPFYPWWMILFITFVVGIIAFRYPLLSLILVTFFTTAEIGYQSPELGFVFLVSSIFVLCVSLFDWKFGALVYLMLFLAPFGVPFVVPMVAAMVYSLILGLAVSIVGTILLTLFVTLGNFQTLGFFVGPLAPGMKTIVAGHTEAIKPPLENFQLSDFGAAFTSITNLDNRVFEAAIGNFGLSIVPFIEIILWALAVYVVSLMIEHREKMTMVNWALYSLVAAGILMASTGIAMAMSTNYTYPLIAYALLPGIIPAVFLATALGLLSRDIFTSYFASKLGATAVGTRIAEMKALSKTTFDMVGGLKDVKADIRESMIVPLLRKDVAEQFGLEPPKGLLLFGPPGCGKTLLMKALATELRVEMISVKCSDLMSKWYGESENRVAELFKTAKERKPCILFLDEIDAIAKRRDMYSADDVSPRLLSIILAEMDGLDKASGVIVVGTTNKPEMVDPALMRPGRFDKIIYVPPPDFEERIDILKVHLMGKPTAPDIDLSEIAKRTERFSGADLANLVREAAILAMKRSLKTNMPSLITMNDFLTVLPNIKPSITLRMKEEYEKLKMDYERKMHQLQRAEKKVVIKFEDVGGLDDVKRALREYVELPLTKPELMEQFKLKTGKGILLFGPPGCGKTHIMRAASNELNVPIQVVNGPELVSALAGQSEAAIRDVMARARENAPSILFFDEIDALASKESMKTPEVNRAVSQFLTELDGMRPKDRVIVVATTNRPHLLDPALLRPGRFDKIFYVPPPDLKAREDIFRIHLKDVPTAGYIDYRLLAHRTEGYSGADIAAIVDEAKLIAIREMVSREEGFGSERAETRAKIEFTRYLDTVVSADQKARQATGFGVRMEHLLEALSKTRSSITPETIEWAKTFMEMYGTR
ncbi:MAG: AAA family ATPase [Thermoplasmata archaeon]